MSSDPILEQMVKGLISDEFFEDYLMGRVCGKLRDMIDEKFKEWDDELLYGTGKREPLGVISFDGNYPDRTNPIIENAIQHALEGAF